MMMHEKKAEGMGKLKNNWLWRHSFVYGFISAPIAVGLLWSGILTSYSLPCILSIPFWIAVYDGYRRDVLYEWKCTKCGWKEFARHTRHKFCVRCGGLMSAFIKKKEEDVV